MFPIPSFHILLSYQMHGIVTVVNKAINCHKKTKKSKTFQGPVACVQAI